MPAAPHPTSDELRSYLQGRLPDVASDTIATHLDDCAECSTVIDRLETSDSLQARLRTPVVPDPLLGESQLHRALEFVKQVGHGGPAPVASPAGPLERIREYELLSLLGEGGMGAVYLARHTRLDKQVALKLLPRDRTQDAAAVARFAREMRAVGKLDHPNIVRAMDAGEHDGRHYLVMEHVQGLDLGQLVRQLGPLPVAEACELIRQAAVGLSHAHQHGLVHRDIKPSNLMLTTAGQVKILDLGLALLGEQSGELRELTSSGQMMGTLDYMAPEQGGDSHLVDIRADLYALGATLYKLLTGEAPFSGEKYRTPVQKLMALATDLAPPVESRRADVPPELAAIVAKLLAKSPDQRYATPAELAAALTPLTADANLQQLIANATGTAPVLASPADVATHPSVRSGSIGTAPARLAVKPTIVLPSSTVKRGHRPPWLLIAAAGFLGLAALGIILSIRTPHGEIVVELGAGVSPESVKIEVSGDGTTKIVDQSSGWTIDVKEGKHHVTLTGASQDHLQIDQSTVEVTRHKAMRVKVTLRPNSVAKVVSSTTDKAASPAPSGSAVDPSAPQRATKPFRWQPGPTAALVDGFATRPAVLPGVSRWQVMPVEPMDHISSVAWHPTQDLIAAHSATREGVRVYDVSGDQFRLEAVLPVVSKSALEYVGWSPDGKHLALASSEQQITIWDYAERRTISVLEVNADYESKRHCFAWSSDSRHAAAIGLQGSIDIWDALVGKKLRSLDDKQPAKSLAWSPDGKWLAVGRADNAIQLWDMSKEVPGPTLAGHTKPVTSLAWSPKSEWIASQAYGTTNVNVWGVDGKLFKSQETGSTHRQVLSWRRDGKELFLQEGWSSGNTFGTTWLLFGSSTPEKLPWGVAGGHLSVFSPHSDRLLTWNQTSLYLWEQRDGKWRPLSPFGEMASIKVASTATGKSFVAQDHRGNVSLWEPGQWRARSIPSKFPLGNKTNFSRQLLTLDGRFLAAHDEGNPKKLLIFEPQRGAIYREFPLDSATAFAWSPDDIVLATGSADGGLRLWDIPNGQRQHLMTGHTSEIRALFWSPDGKRIVSQSADKSTRLWDPAAGKSVAELQVAAKNDFVPRIGWHTETGRMAVTNGNQVLIANSETGEKIDSFDFKTAIRDVHWIDADHLVVVQANDPKSAQCRVACWNLQEKYFVWDKTLSATVSPETYHAWTELSPDRKSLGVFCLEPMMIETTTGVVASRPKSFAEISWPLDHRNRFSMKRDTFYDVYIHHNDITGDIDWRGAVLAKTVPVYVSAAGEVLNPSPEVDEQLRYVLELESGQVVTLTPADFRKQFDAKMQ
ncbi:MAG: protein kinase [Pirellulaceae bacterium]|nr:protein kinase [Pirellulaceae bacterium]